MSKKKMTIKSIEAYQTTDGEIFTGSDAKAEAAKHQNILNSKARIKYMAPKVLDAFPSKSLVKLSTAPDSEEALDLASDLVELFDGVEVRDPFNTSGAIATVEDVVAIFMDVDSKFPGVIDKIMKIIRVNR